MSDNQAQNEPVASPDPGEQQNPLEVLRGLLLDVDRKRLQSIEKQVQKPIDAETVGPILPSALRLAARTELADALGPTVTDAMRDSVRKDPQPLVDAISPIIGPAIRRAISQSLKSMVETFNRTLEDSLSLRGLQWRLESWRTGTSFAEVVMLNTLVYQVDHVFLIHRETGLLLNHVTNAMAIGNTDPSMVSGMLTALESFVHDSFGDSDDLKKMDCGDRTVWIEKGPFAFLAASIQGHAPESYRIRLQEALEQLRPLKVGRPKNPR